MSIPHALRLAAHFDSWAGGEWSYVDAAPVVQLAELVGGSLANLIERKRTVEHAASFRRRLAGLLATIREFNDAYPLKWRDLPDGGSETDSRGVAVVLDDCGGLDMAHDGRKPEVHEAARPAIRAAAELADYIGGWADEFATRQDLDNAFEIAMSHADPDIAEAMRQDYCAKPYWPLDGLPREIACLLDRGDFPKLDDDEYAKLGAWLTANAGKVYHGLDPANVAKTQRMEEAKKRLRAVLEYNAALRQSAVPGTGGGDTPHEPQADGKGASEFPRIFNRDCFDDLGWAVLGWRNGVLPHYWSGEYYPGHFAREAQAPLQRCLVKLDSLGLDALARRLQSAYDELRGHVEGLDSEYGKHPCPADASDSGRIQDSALWPSYDKAASFVDLVREIRNATEAVRPALQKNGGQAVGQQGIPGEAKAQTDSKEQPGATAPPAPVKTKGRRRGRKEVTPAEAAKRNDILAKWQRAEEARTPRKDFCCDAGIAVNYLEKCQEWRRQVDKRSR